MSRPLLLLILFPKVLLLFRRKLIPVDMLCGRACPDDFPAFCLLGLLFDEGQSLVDWFARVARLSLLNGDLADEAREERHCKCFRFV